jgi:hypothetical protein
VAEPSHAHGLGAGVLQLEADDARPVAGGVAVAVGQRVQAAVAGSAPPAGDGDA